MALIIVPAIYFLPTVIATNREDMSRARYAPQHAAGPDAGRVAIRVHLVADRHPKRNFMLLLPVRSAVPVEAAKPVRDIDVELCPGFNMNWGSATARLL